MSRTVQAAAEVALDPLAAQRLWTDADRWASFVEGYQRLVERSDDWPARGSRIVWESGPDGRGRVTERVEGNGGGRFATEVFEERLTGLQAVAFAPAGDGERARVSISLEYALVNTAPLRVITDVVFIRPALRSALERTLRRFAVECEEEAGLR